MQGGVKKSCRPASGPASCVSSVEARPFAASSEGQDEVLYSSAIESGRGWIGRVTQDRSFNDRTDGAGAAPPLDYTTAIRRCVLADHAALKAIYDRDAATLLGVAQRILRRRDLAEEAVHDTFVQIWRRAGTFDPRRGSGRAWIFAILRNRALNILRDGGREDLVADAAPETADERPDPEEAVALLGEKSRLRSCLEALEPNRRAGIVLAYAHGLTHGEIAARLGVPLGTAKSWIRRALVSVKECMR